MVATHQEVDSIVAHEVDEAVFLRDPARPDVGPEVLDGFGLSNAGERVTHDRFDELEHAKGCATISLNPELKILPELVLEDGETGGSGGFRLRLFGGQGCSSGCRWFGARPNHPMRVVGR